MKAVQITAFGGPEVLKYQDAPTPEPGPGQVRIKVAATSVNFADIQTRRGGYRDTRPLPFTPGLEMAGTIDALGPGVTGLEIGQRVAAHADGGSYSEYAIARPVGIFALADEVGWEEAAVFPSVGTTAFNLLTMAARLQPGETVVIHAAAGGVGSTAVQLARVLGAGFIIGTVGSSDKAKVARDLGADATINYQHENIVDRVKALTGGTGADIVLDGVGAATSEASVACLAPFGRVVAFGQASGPPVPVAFGPIYRDNKSVIGYSSGGIRGTRPELMRQPGLAVMKLLAQGRWKPLIGARYPLAQAAEAQRLVEDRESIGKVLLLT
ncbi:MAG: NADPH:quinone reductase [Chloroflexota bacterium]|jgi:NADPH2:quinone reductase|nr:NADPH:quinone reductase [Chloroflexota bacterium]